METLIYETGDRVARITLDRPERGNGLTRGPLQLAAFVERADLIRRARHPAAGNGKGFCGGYDLVDSAEGRLRPKASVLRPTSGSPLDLAARTRHTTPRPGTRRSSTTR